MTHAPRRRRGRCAAQLLLGILLPVLALIALNTVSLYRQALRAADTAYDRTLLASAKSIGEQLEVSGSGDEAQLQATVPYSALEPFEADNRSRMFYRVSGFHGEMVSGFEDLPPWRGTLPDQGPLRRAGRFLRRPLPRRAGARGGAAAAGGRPGRPRHGRRSRWPRRWSCARRWRARS